MGRRHRRRQKADARGYYQQGAATPSRAAAAAPRAFVASSNNKAAVAAHRDLEELLMALRLEQDTHDSITTAVTQTPFSVSPNNNNNNNTTTLSVSSAPRLRKRLTAVYDGLTAWQFDLEHLQQVVQALGYHALTLEYALDWLVVHLPTPQLPRLFREAAAAADEEKNDETLQQQQQLTVLLPPATTTLTSTTTRTTTATATTHAEDARSLPSTVVVVAVDNKGSHSENSNQHDEEEAATKQQEEAAQKAWLLQQYQYEESSSEEEEETIRAATIRTTTTTTPTTTNDNHHHHANTTTTTTTVTNSSVDDRHKDTSSSLLHQQLESQLAQLQQDLADEAGNYMRSKHEIQDMRQSAQRLRQRLQALQRKTQQQAQQQQRQQQRQQQQQAQAQLAKEEENEEAMPEETAAVVVATAEDPKDNDDDGGLLLACMFDEDDNKPKEESSGTTTTDTPDDDSSPPPQLDEEEEEPFLLLHIPDDAIPKSWTGTTPKKTLEEWCRKQKLSSRPSFSFLQKTDRHYNYYQCRVPLGQQVLEIQEACRNNQDKHTLWLLQHYLATRALYRLCPDLALYRLFPPFYRQAWLDWTVEQTAVDQQQAREQDQARQDRIDQLLQLLLLPRAVQKDAMDDKNDNEPPLLEEPVDPVLDGKTEVLESWDDSDGEGAAASRSMTPPGGDDDDDDNVKHVAPTLEEDQRLQRQFAARRHDPQIMQARQALPVFAFRQDILDAVAQHPVVIISAETGAGKTTQVPQFIVAQALEEGRGSQVSVLCTQPRRVAATSVAERVAEEMGEKSVGGMVGYQIRLETKRSKATKLLFCTTGVILRRLADDPTLSGVTHCVVDECHERQWQIDLLLASLRTLLTGLRPDLKVILMSATLDADLFSSYFGGAPLLTVPGRTFPVAHYYLEDVLERTGHVIEEGSRCAKRNYERQETVSLWVTTRGGERRRETAAMESETEAAVSDDFIGYSLPTRRSMDRVDESRINYDLIEDALRLVCEDQEAFAPPETGKMENGATLIFLPGIGEIKALSDQLLASRFFGNPQRFEIVPLHSSLSSTDQRRAFTKLRKGVRKIIISTNIAETSITIPDVTCVIDTGLVRELQRDKRTGTRKLVSVWCSRANTKQRAGRAGRVQPGICLRLFSSRTEGTMKKTTEPEIKRIPLEEICLSVLASGLARSCKEFLKLTPEPPPDAAVDFALETLRDIGAIVMPSEVTQSFETLTPLGEHLTKLPIDARLGKMLIFGCIFKCLAPVLTIAACLSASQSPFSLSVTGSNVEKAKHATFSHPTSDFFGLVHVWEAYWEARTKGAARRFCKEYYLNYRAMQEIDEARGQFLSLLCGLGLIKKQDAGYASTSRRHSEETFAASSCCANSRKEDVVHAVVGAGLYPNIARLSKGVTGPPTLWHKTEQLVIRSTSVNSKLTNANLPSLWMAFHEKLATGVRATSISTTCFVHPIALMIFGPSLKVLHLERKVVVDDWIELNVAAKTGVMFREIRHHVDRVLKLYVQRAAPQADDDTASEVIDRIVDLLCQTN